MATTEERLAELEAKMAALTTPPDDYYTSRYSGEEIDNGIDRAKSGGAIDKAIQAKANPNLLDNWYFGNPVDQRGGYIQFGGTTMYKDPELTVEFGASSGTTPVVMYSTYARPIDHGVELNLYIKRSDCVRGYTGAGYGIDRWRLTGGGTVAVVDDGLTLTSPPQWNGLWQYGENFANFKGTKLTLSFLVKSIENPGEFYATIRVSDTLVNSVTINNAGLATATFDVTEEPTMLRVALCANVANAGSVTIQAAKLELGSQQTLAHQDENGNWILNEIPDYGEQLRRCQRYFVNFNPYKMPYFAMPPAVASNAYQAYSAVTLPVAMRAQPVVAYGGNIVLSQEANHAVTSILVSDNTFTGNSIQLRYNEETGSLTANSLYRVQGDKDASAYIWLSADL